MRQECKNFAVADGSFGEWLEHPLGAQARAYAKDPAAGKIGGKLHFPADMEIGDAEMLPHIVPELRFRDEDERTCLNDIIGYKDIYVFPPDICKSIEAKAF